MIFAAPRPAVVGHRGAPRRARENTTAAFAAAAGEGATWVELAVRLARDGVLMVHHDAAVGAGPIVEQSSAALESLGVERFDSVLARLPAGLGVDVECKNLPGEPDFDDEDRIARAVANALRPRIGDRPFCVTSFNPSTVAALRAEIPDVPAGLLVAPTLGVAAAAEIAGDLGAGLVCPHRDCPGLDEVTIGAVHGDGLEILVWTVNDPDQARTLAAAGVDALCTDVPGEIVAAVRLDA
jgi:glycerophosphoryl diester phosphodiesterase